MTRVLHLFKGLGRGGAEQIMVSSARHLNDGGWVHQVAYLLPWKDAHVKALEDEGIRTHCLDGARGLGWGERLRRLVRRERIDVVHVHSPYPAAIARAVLPRRSDAKFVYTEHGSWGRQHPVTYWGNLLTFPRNDHVFAVSEEVRSSIKYPRALSRMPMPAVETLYHGIDLAEVEGWSAPSEVREELGIDPDATVVGTVANFRPQKGHRYLLDAAAIVARSTPSVRFLLVGRGPGEGEARQLAAGLGLGDTVLFTGFREDAPRVASTFDVFVLPSVFEGLSIALVEAMALGKPPVVTTVGGNREVVRDGVNGLTVPARDPEALAAAIMTLIDDPALRSDLGVAARRRAADFDVSRSVERQRRVYEELLA
jgi:glycosyltransferase involved in cell wall biosynthesis